MTSSIASIYGCAVATGVLSAQTPGTGRVHIKAVEIVFRRAVTEMNQNAEGDAERLAKVIAKQIKKSMVAQDWISSAP